MTTLLTTVYLLSITWVLHIALWRVRLPKNQTRALLVIFAVVFGVWLLMFAPSLRLISVLRVMTLSIPLFLCYVITYSAIEGDSPTLSLMKMLADEKQTGVPKDAVFRFFLSRPFIQSRLDTLVRSGLIKVDGKRLVIAEKPSIAFKFVLGFRKLFGPISKGG
jgi:hypothetical protein